MNAPPLFTIVTPTLDRVAMLPTAIDSVSAQGEWSVEHVIIDGGSTDGTLELLERFEGLRVLRQSGRGVYQGLNQALALARGRIVGFLNSDDRYAPSAFEAAADLFETSGEIAQVGGIARFEDPRARPPPPARATMDLCDLAFGAPVLNARFFRREALRALGPFREDLPRAADRELLIRARFKHMPFLGIDETLYVYVVHGGSLTLGRQPDLAGSLAGEHHQVSTSMLDLAESSAERAVLSAWRAWDRPPDPGQAMGPGPSTRDALGGLGWKAVAGVLKARTRARRVLRTPRT